jgi:IS1 family transposase
VDVQQAGEAEMDARWSFVGKKGNQRWLWHAIDHQTGAVLGYVFGRRKDEVFLTLKALLEPFGLTRFSTDYWGAYTRHLDPDVHSCVFHGFLPPNPWEGCHSIHVKAATQST